MTKTSFQNGTVVTPGFLNAMVNAVCKKSPSIDGEIQSPTFDEIKDLDWLTKAIVQELFSSLGLNPGDHAADPLSGAAIAAFIRQFGDDTNRILRAKKLISSLFSSSFDEVHSLNSSGLSIFSVCQSGDLPIGKYDVSGNLNIVPSSTETELLSFDSVLSEKLMTSDNYNSEIIFPIPFHSFYSFSGQNLPVISVSVPRRIIALSSPGKIYLNTSIRRGSTFPLNIYASMTLRCVE